MKQSQLDDVQLALRVKTWLLDVSSSYLIHSVSPAHPISTYKVVFLKE